MATNYPTSKDDGTTLPNPTAGSARNSPSLAAGQDNQNDAIIAIQNKLGTGASVAASGKLLRGTGAGASAWDKDAPTGTIVGTSDSQVLTNKTLTSPIINSPTIANATISTDSVTGYTTSNTGSIYGMQITTGSITSGLTNLTTTGSVTVGNALNVTAGAVTVPKGSLSSDALWGPYKFSVYRLAALTPAGTAVLTCDTKLFDTGNNVDVTTNKGRFTAPINGYYYFNGSITVGAGARAYIALYKNGSRVKQGTDIIGGGAGATSIVGGLLYLLANDYVEVYCNTGSTALTVGDSSLCYFDGYLVFSTKAV